MNVDYVKYENEEACSELIKFLKTMVPDISKQNWLWEYRKNPEFKGVVWVAKCDKKILAHYAFILGNYKYNNVVYKVAKAEGSLANIKEIIKLPKNERRVFKRLVDHAVSDLKKHNTDFIYGFPNNQAIKSQVEAGYLKKEIPIYLSNLIFSFYKYKFFNSNLKSSNKLILKVFSRLWNLFYKLYANLFLKP